MRASLSERLLESQEPGLSLSFWKGVSTEGEDQKDKIKFLLATTMRYRRILIAKLRWIIVILIKSYT
jgi:hypothetical protein